MMLSDALKYIYPDLDFRNGCRLIDRSDGAGVVIAEWLDPRPQPTQAEIDAAVLPGRKAVRIAAIRAEARQRIEATYPDWRQRSAALGLYPAEYVSTMQAAIASVIAASNTAEDAVDAAADVAAVEAVTVTWPVI